MNAFETTKSKKNGLLLTKFLFPSSQWYNNKTCDDDKKKRNLVVFCCFSFQISSWKWILAKGEFYDKTNLQFLVKIAKASELLDF